MYKRVVVKKEEKYPYPSRFGSHSSMIVHADSTLPSLVVLEDEHGLYTTDISRVDSGLSDSHRYAASRLKLR